MKTWRIVQNIYEGDEREPTLTHVFYGETRKRAGEVYQAHMRSDSFMRDCVTQGRFSDFSCRAESYLERKERGVWRRV